MLEKIKAVNNPLTIIAIFAALAEVAGTGALAAVDKELQATFIWFVMGFPVFLVAAFFLTLNFNPKVLYAPSDFRDDEFFLEFNTGTKTLSSNLDSLAQQLETLPEKVVDQVSTSVLDKIEQDQRGALREVVNSSISEIKSLVGATQGTAQHLNELKGDLHTLFTSRPSQSDSAAGLVNLVDFVTRSRSGKGAEKSKG